jgi:UDP-N-acetylmuramyl pentapeptide synthase
MSVRTFIKQTIIAILSAEARAVVRRRRPRIVAITGSVGKTSTKDALFTVMAPTYDTRASKKSFNSEFGVPLTILDLPTGWNSPRVWILNILRGAWRIISPAPYPTWLILETGADHPGDITRSLNGISIDIAVITRIGDTPVHVEFFPSVDAVAHEKASLLSCLAPNGTAILNGDDPRVAPLAKTLSSEQRAVLYGTGAHNDIRAEHIHIVYVDDKPSGLSFTIITHNGTYPVTLSHTIGMHHAYTALAAFVIATVAGVSPEDAITRLGTVSPTPGRLHLIEGMRGITIIDDTYNASPVAVVAGLATLRDIVSNNQKIAILGDMLELGEFTDDAHRAIGTDAVSSCDILIAVGQYAPLIAEGATNAGMNSSAVLAFIDSHETATHITSLVADNATVFVKGSQGARMEHIVKALMAHPEQAPSLLVRQEKEWEKKKRRN